MYTTIVRRIVRTGFRALSAGDYEQLLRRFHPQVIFSFAGPAPLGGERRGVEAVREWFQRVFSYFPGIQFTVHHVIVQGWPWNTLVATRLSVAAPRADGSMYRNEAMQFLRLCWGKVVEDHLYEDTYKLAGELQQRLGHEEIIKGKMPTSSSEQCTVYRLSGTQVRFDRPGVAIGREATYRSPAE